MPEKIQRLRPSLNPRTRVPEVSMLTTRPPKPPRFSVTSKPTYDSTQFNTQQTINGATPAKTARKRTNQFMFAAALA